MQSRSPEAQISGGEARFFNALRTTRSTALPGKSGYNCVTKCWQNKPRQLCGFALRKTARGDQGFQVRDLQVACRFNASHFTTSIHSMKSSTVSAASPFFGSK